MYRKTMQTPFLRVVRKIVQDAGRYQEFLNDELFEMRVEHPVFHDLIIQSWNEQRTSQEKFRDVLVAHYCPFNGNIMVIELMDNGSPIRLQVGYRDKVVVDKNRDGTLYFNPSSRKEIMDFLDGWQRVLKGYIGKTTPKRMEVVTK